MRRGRAAREERTEARRGPVGGAGSVPSPAANDAMGTRFQMRQRMVSIGDDFWIENEHGRKVFKVDGKAIRVRGTLIFEDPRGQELLKIQARIARVRDTMNIEDAGGSTAAVVHNALITPLRDRWQVDLPGRGEDMIVQGNILNHEYHIDLGRRQVAEVSKKWFRLRDSYGVQVAPGQNVPLLLAITVVIDMMAHEGR